MSGSIVTLAKDSLAWQGLVCTSELEWVGINNQNHSIVLRWDNWVQQYKHQVQYSEISAQRGFVIEIYII